MTQMTCSRINKKVIGVDYVTTDVNCRLKVVFKVAK